MTNENEELDFSIWSREEIQDSIKITSEKILRALENNEDTSILEVHLKKLNNLLHRIK